MKELSFNNPAFREFLKRRAGITCSRNWKAPNDGQAFETTTSKGIVIQKKLIMSIGMKVVDNHVFCFIPERLQASISV
jgi:hypothetical protein